MRLSVFTSVAALLALGACGGTSGVSYEDNTALQSRLRAAEAGYNRTTAQTLTSNDRMPTRGSATFNGVAAIGIAQGVPGPDPDYLIVGDAALSANFARGRVTGKIDNLEGFSPLGEIGFTVPVTGQVTLGGTRSSIGNNPATAATEEKNEFSTDFAAAMSVDGKPLRAAGTVRGQFVGNRVLSSPLPAPKSMVGSGVGGGTLDGKAATVGVEFYADVP
ncbi:MAG: hypothetical protein KKB02_09025 [Alphaproteobacteria bacterium]|nr:hypothetical protein [Alphaproteobacteria bacterium]